MDVGGYLDRIDYHGGGVVSAEALCALQLCHYKNVPYENLDILAGKPLRLDSEGLYEKIVRRRRGGYCFELNGAFGSLLRAMGFSVKDCMARFLLNETEIPMRRHRVLKVEMPDGLFLSDVGIGSPSPVTPVFLETETEQKIGNEYYKVSHEPFFGTVIHQRTDGEWKRFFSFTDEPQLDIDFIMPSFYCENSPDSIFNKGCMVAILNDDGFKNGISGNTYTLRSKSGTVTGEFTDDENKKQFLSKYFKLEAEED